MKYLVLGLSSCLTSSIQYGYKYYVRYVDKAIANKLNRLGPQNIQILTFKNSTIKWLAKRESSERITSKVNLVHFCIDGRETKAALDYPLLLPALTSEQTELQRVKILVQNGVEQFITKRQCLNGSLDEVGVLAGLKIKVYNGCNNPADKDVSQERRKIYIHAKQFAIFSQGPFYSLP